MHHCLQTSRPKHSLKRHSALKASTPSQHRSCRCGSSAAAFGIRWRYAFAPTSVASCTASSASATGGAFLYASRSSPRPRPTSTSRYGMARQAVYTCCPQPSLKTSKSPSTTSKPASVCDARPMPMSASLSRCPASPSACAWPRRCCLSTTPRSAASLATRAGGASGVRAWSQLQPPFAPRRCRGRRRARECWRTAWTGWDQLQSRWRHSNSQSSSKPTSLHSEAELAKRHTVCPSFCFPPLTFAPFLFFKSLPFLTFDRKSEKCFGK